MDLGKRKKRFQEDDVFCWEGIWREFISELVEVILEESGPENLSKMPNRTFRYAAETKGGMMK